MSIKLNLTFEEALKRFRSEGFLYTMVVNPDKIVCVENGECIDPADINLVNLFLIEGDVCIKLYCLELNKDNYYKALLIERDCKDMEMITLSNFLRKSIIK